MTIARGNRGSPRTKGVRKNKETPRDFYARKEVWNAVYARSVPELQDAMDLAYSPPNGPATC